MAASSAVVARLWGGARSGASKAGAFMGLLPSSTACPPASWLQAKWPCRGRKATSQPSKLPGRLVHTEPPPPSAMYLPFLLYPSLESQAHNGEESEGRAEHWLRQHEAPHLPRDLPALIYSPFPKASPLREHVLELMM